VYKEETIMQKVMSSFRFILLWIPATIFALIASLISFATILFGGSIVAIYIWGQEEVISGNGILIFMLVLYSMMGVAMGLLYGSLQKALLRQKTDEPWRGWTTASVIGGIFGINLTIILVGRQVAEYLLWFVMPPPEMLFLLGIQVTTIPFACISFAQMFILGQHVRGAWTWVLANIVAGLVLFSLIAAGIFSIGTSPLLSIAALLALSAAPSIVTGFAMIFLLNFNWKHDYLEL
jgi:hypothetical protein